MSLATLTGRVRDLVGVNSGLGYAVAIELADSGVIFIDGRAVPNQVTNEPGEADCVLRLDSENFTRMLDGDLSSTFAYMNGKLKVEGSLGVAMKLASLFE